MLTDHDVSGFHAFSLSASSSYCDKVRAAHALADMLKRTRPHLYEKIIELQATVTRCQHSLDASKVQQQNAALTGQHAVRSRPGDFRPSAADQTTIRELDTPLDDLLHLRHKGQMAK